MRNTYGESGFSIISVLVALALISLVVVTAGQSFINSMRARSSLSSRLNAEEVNQAVLKVVQNIAKAPPATGCYTAADITQKLAAYPFMSFNTQVASGLTAGQQTALNSQRFAFASAAVQRCQAPQFITQAANTNQHTMYFCLRFNRDPGHSADSISGSPHAFAEVRIELIDAHQNQGTSCDNFRNLKQGAMQVYYSLYWANEAAGGLEYVQRNSFFHVTK